MEILDILFEESRRHCAEVGVRVGTRARCRERTDDGIRLDLSDGRRAEIESSLASFIWVHVLEPGAPADLPSVQTPLSGRISTP